MPKGRPAISAEVVREIMIEAGHRRAVDGTRFPLEKAHIVAWNESKDHTAENLIVLCANCHEMFDLGKIDTATIKEYKKRPWVSRYNNTQPAPVETKETKKAQITIDVKLEDFNELQGRLLQHALAAFLNISPSDVKVGPPEESNSITVTVELPSDKMKEFLDAFERGDPDLFAYLTPFGLLSLRVVQSHPEIPSRTRESVKIPHSTGHSLGIIRLYVGNLSYQTTESDLINLFEQVGAVESVNIITDRDTGRSKGFGFVEMNAEDADKAIAQFNGVEVNGRSLTVNEARPREERSGRRGGFGGGPSRGGGGGGRFGGQY